MSEITMKNPIADKAVYTEYLKINKDKIETIDSDGIRIKCSLHLFNSVGGVLEMKLTLVLRMF